MRTVPGYYHDAVVIAELLQDFFGWEKVTLFATTDSYGSQAAFRFKDEASKRGIEILSSHSFLVDSVDLSHEIKAAKAAGARVFVLLLGATDGFNLLEQGYDMGLFSKNTQIIGGGHMSHQNEWDAAGLSASRMSPYLRGFIGVSWELEVVPSAEVTAFIQRWRARNSTAGVVQPDGSVVCDDRMDYYKNFYLHQFQPFDNATAPPVCAGVNFSSYSEDGSDLVEEMYAYDAVMTIALALHDIVYVQGVCDPPPSDLLRYLQYSFAFTGLTGNVSFSTKYSNQFFDVGGRDTNLVYGIVNYDPSSTSLDGQGSVTFKVPAKWHSEQGFLPCNGHVQFNSKCHDFTFRTSDNLVVHDSPQPHVTAMPAYFSGLMWLFAVACLVMVVPVLVVVLSFRSRRICRMAQPGMILLICGGLLLACVRVILAVQKLTKASCIGEIWTGHLAFILIVTTLGAKTWRVYMVTNAMKKVKISESKCVGIVLGVVSLGAFFIAVHSAVDDIHVEKVTIVQDQLEYTKQLKCVVGSYNGMYPLFALEVLLALLTGRMLWYTRHVASTISSTSASAAGKNCLCC